MNNYFKRQIELWGKEKQILLANKKVAIIGSGGLGSAIAIALGSVGIGQLYLIDFDEVAIHNIHRQIAFKTEDVGKEKAEVLANYVQSRSEHTKIDFFVESFEQWQNKKMQIDLIIDGTDNLRTRAKIDKFAKEFQIPWIYGSVEAFHGQACLFKNSSFTTFQTDGFKPKGVSAPMVMNIASFQANLGLKYLIGDKVETDILYYLSFDNDGMFKIKSFKMPKS
jgi:adenylyltransferase/sulfurtransferase